MTSTGPCGLDYPPDFLAHLRAMTDERLAAQVEYHEDALTRAETDRARRVLGENLRILRQIAAERDS